MATKIHAKGSADDHEQQPENALQPVEQLAGWLAELGLGSPSIEPLAGDISVRSYFRIELENGGHLIAAFHPPPILGALDRFLESTRLLEHVGVPVPRIEAAKRDLGLLLLEDLGRQTLYDIVGACAASARPALLERALAESLGLIARMQTIAPERCAGLNPPLDRGLLARELDQTWEVFLERRIGLDRSKGLGRDLESWLAVQLDHLQEATLVPCHRDFMARNLLPKSATSDVSENSIYVIDHQDLRLGPAAYDAASLLNDSVYPDSQQVKQLLAAAEFAIDHQQYLRCVVQRGLKIIGTFERFAERGRPRYLALVPETIGRVFEAMSALATSRDEAGLGRALSQRLHESPAAPQRPTGRSDL